MRCTVATTRVERDDRARVGGGFGKSWGNHGETSQHNKNKNAKKFHASAMSKRFGLEFQQIVICDARFHWI